MTDNNTPDSPEPAEPPQAQFTAELAQSQDIIGYAEERKEAWLEGHRMTNRFRSGPVGQGGARPGAGRPPGSKNQRSANVARQATEAGITPIEVMLSVMRELWEEGSAISKREAAKIAKDAAPYVHPRLASIDQTVREASRFVIHAPMPCSVEEWEANVKAGRYGPSKDAE